MSAKTNNFKIGIFVIIAVLLLIAGVLAFGAKSYFEKKTMFETAIPSEVYGLSVGSRVELRGVPVGTVAAISFAWNLYPKAKANMIVVEFEIDQAILPHREGESTRALAEQAAASGLRAIVKSQGVTGTSLLALEVLDPKENPAPEIDYKPRHLYIPSAAGQFTRMLDAIERSLRKVEGINISGVNDGISNILTSISTLSSKLNELDVKQISDNVNSVLVELRGTLADVQKNINGMKLESIGTNANALVEGLRETNVKLQTVLDHVGAVPMQATVGDLREAVQTLNGVLLELKQYPSGFIFGKPPLPAQSVQPPPK